MRFIFDEERDTPPIGKNINIMARANVKDDHQPAWAQS
jgi:hypothetical protein